MGRPPRVQPPDFPYHVTSCGNRGCAVFVDDADRNRFLRILGSTLRREAITCHEFCLLTTHYHLLVTPSEDNLAVAMHRLNSVYANTFNRRHGLKGHLFERRYWSARVQTDSHFLEVVRYIALNPVRAGLCRDPKEWRWGSYAGLFGWAPLPDFVSPAALLQTLGPTLQSALVALEAFVAEGLAADRHAEAIGAAAYSL
jgi:putative transposase